MRAPVRVTFDDGVDCAVVAGWKVRELIAVTGGRAIWSARRHGWMVTKRCARDVVAAAERDGRPVVLTEGGGRP